MPPPPAQMTTAPRSSSQVTGWISRICTGRGEGTTRRHAAPSWRKLHPLAAASASAASFSYTGPTNFVGLPNAGSAGSTATMVSRVTTGLPGGSMARSSCWMR